MMATTHGFAGLAIAASVAVLFPEYALPAAAGGLIGGVFPDLDVVAEHRRTLHFPVYYTVAAIGAIGSAILFPGPLTVGVAVGLIAAAVHAVSDAIGGGPSMRPWAEDSDRGVYVHALGRWERPREWIRYDGAPEDFLVGLLLAVPGFLVFDGVVHGIIAIGVVIALVYTVVRRPLGRHFTPEP